MEYILWIGLIFSIFFIFNRTINAGKVAVGETFGSLSNHVFFGFLNWPYLPFGMKFHEFSTISQPKQEEKRSISTLGGADVNTHGAMQGRLPTPQEYEKFVERFGNFDHPTELQQPTYVHLYFFKGNVAMENIKTAMWAAIDTLITSMPFELALDERMIKLIEVIIENGLNTLVSYTYLKKEMAPYTELETRNIKYTELETKTTINISAEEKFTKLFTHLADQYTKEQELIGGEITKILPPNFTAHIDHSFLRIGIKQWALENYGIWIELVKIWTETPNEIQKARRAKEANRIRLEEKAKEFLFADKQIKKLVETLSEEKADTLYGLITGLKKPQETKISKISIDGMDDILKAFTVILTQDKSSQSVLILNAVEKLLKEIKKGGR